MDKKVTGIIAYLTLIGWLIAYLAGDKEGAKFHLNQALVLAICNIANVIIGMIHFPPFNSVCEDSEFTKLFEKYNVKKVV